MLSNSFPRVVGGDGFGKMVAVGNGVTDFKGGDEDYGYAFGSAKGGFYAVDVAAMTNTVAHMPEGDDLLHGAALAIPSTTALRGLTTALGLKSGQSVGKFGATGGVGWPAVLLAKAMGVKVFAVGSGQERVENAQRAGAHITVDSKTGDVAAAVKVFAPEGLDAVLATANESELEQLIAALRPGGKVTWPGGVQPEPTSPAGREAKVYHGEIGRDLLAKLSTLVAGRDYEIAMTDPPFRKAADAQRLLPEHVVGRPMLVVGA